MVVVFSSRTSCRTWIIAAAPSPADNSTASAPVAASELKPPSRNKVRLGQLMIITPMRPNKTAVQR